MEALGTLEDPGDRFPEAQSRRQTIRAISHAGKIERLGQARSLWGLIAIVGVYAVSLLVGVGRQYTGTSGKVDNAHVAVYLTYATTARARA
jgi:hypothetical protein